jgi:anti-sigma factor RsiW
MDRETEARERERASKRARAAARRCGWISSSAVRVRGLGLLSAGYVLPGIPSPGLLFFQIAQKSD